MKKAPQRCGAFFVAGPEGPMGIVGLKRVAIFQVGSVRLKLLI
jgi:hypothetical protein